MAALAPADVAARLSKNQSTVRTLLQKLRDSGYVAKDGDTYAALVKPIDAVDGQSPAPAPGDSLDAQLSASSAASIAPNEELDL